MKTCPKHSLTGAGIDPGKVSPTLPVSRSIPYLPLSRNLCSNLALHPPQQNIRIAWNDVITSNTCVLVQNVPEEQKFIPALPAGSADVRDPHGLHTVSRVRSDGCGSFQRS